VNEIGTVEAAIDAGPTESTPEFESRSRRQRKPTSIGRK
jgi:hypothetical protein